MSRQGVARLVLVLVYFVVEMDVGRVTAAEWLRPKGYDVRRSERDDARGREELEDRTAARTKEIWKNKDLTGVQREPFRDAGELESLIKRQRENAAKYPLDFQTTNTIQRDARYGSEGEARDFARKVVGPDPVDVGDNKLRSQDGRWQYRAKPVDTSAPSPHIHLERLNPKTGEVIENWHLYYQSTR